MSAVREPVGAWAQFLVIATVIVLDNAARALVEETALFGAHFMMGARSARDLVRYDLKWIIQEKMRLLGCRRAR